MNPLRRWMQVVGAFYVLMALFNTPPVIEARFGMQYPDLGVAVESAAVQALVDTWFMFGLEAGVIGVALLYCSRHPYQHRSLVWTVLALEMVRGIADDLYLIARGYDPIIYLAWIAVHGVIVTTGVVAIRRARANASRSTQRLDRVEVAR